MLVSLLVLLLTAHAASAAVTFLGTGPLPILVYRAILSVRRRRFEIDDLDASPAREFVRVLAGRFRSQGYRVKRAPRRLMHAYDFLLRQHGRRIAVQISPSAAPLGPDSVQRLLAAMAKCRAESGWIITNSSFTREAEALAEGGPVTLWDRFRLAGFLLETAIGPNYGYSEDVAE